MIKNKMIMVDDEELIAGASSVPLLSVQGYAKKGGETQKLALEINKLLKEYQKATSMPKSIYSYSMAHKRYRGLRKSPKYGLQVKK